MYMCVYMCVCVCACVCVCVCVCVALTLLAAIRGLLRVFLCWVLTLAPDARAPHKGDVVVGGAVTPPHLTGQ